MQKPENHLCFQEARVREAALGQLWCSPHSGFQPLSVARNDSTLASWQPAPILTPTHPASILWWEERADGEMIPLNS